MENEKVINYNRKIKYDGWISKTPGEDKRQT